MEDREFDEIESLFLKTAEKETPNLWDRIEKAIVQEESRAAEAEFQKSRTESDDPVGMTGTLREEEQQKKAGIEEPDPDHSEDEMKGEKESLKVGTMSSFMDAVSKEEAAEEPEATTRLQKVDTEERRDSSDVTPIRPVKKQDTKNRQYMWKVVSLAAAAVLLMMIGIPAAVRAGRKGSTEQTSSNMSVAASNEAAETADEDVFDISGSDGSYAGQTGGDVSNLQAITSAAAEAVTEAFAETVEETASDEVKAEGETTAGMNREISFIVKGTVTEQGGSYYISVEEMVDDSEIPESKRGFYEVKNLRLLIVDSRGKAASEYLDQTITAVLCLGPEQDDEFGQAMYSVILCEVQ